MLVYSDRRETVDLDSRLERLRCQLSGLRNCSGIERHAQLVSALIEAGRLEQGAADAGLTEATTLNRFSFELARSVIRSWDSGFASIGDLPELPGLESSACIELREPEGFAFYAVYPETYAEAARGLRLSGPPRVIGVRSIGTTLGAVVAAALGAEPPTTVRPYGDPFDRQVDLPDDIVDDGSHYVIVDEGPGLSGSSFGAAADWLEERGVPLERIAFLPSHSDEPGAQVSERHLLRWRAAQRQAAVFDSTWLEALFGSLEQLHEGERLKFVARDQGGTLMLKFAGLGAIGERKLELARTLHATGYTAEPLAFVHGFLVERRCAGTPLAANDRPVDEIGRYIGARAQLLPADQESGANLDDLLTMCRRNLSLGIGRELTRSWNFERLGQSIRRVCTDNKLDRSKWLRLRDGRLIKCDALDHHRGHDLIGCQDMAWDVAGAIVEFELGAAERAALIRATRRRVDPELLDFYLIAYCSFRLGQASINANHTERARYAAQLKHLLQENS